MADKPLVPRRKVVILRESATAFEAARAMCSNEIGCVLVCDEKGAVTGTITDRDLTCAVIAKNLSVDTTLEKVMTRGVWTVDDHAGAEDVILTMKEHGVRRIAVMKEDKGGQPKCVGIVSLDDLISSRSVRLEDAADVIRSQILHKQHFIQTLRESEIENDVQLKEFISRIEDRSGLTRDTTLSMLTILMSSLVRSVHYSVAEQFLLQLPERLRSRLEDLPAGPDQNISADFLVGEVVARYNLDPEQAIDVIRQFWDAMLTSSGRAELDRFSGQLPEDLKILLTASFSEESPQTQKPESQNPLQMH